MLGFKETGMGYIKLPYGSYKIAFHRLSYLVHGTCLQLNPPYASLP